jgi:hypothetical protein
VLSLSTHNIHETAIPEKHPAIMNNAQRESEQEQGFAPFGQTKFPTFDWLDDLNDPTMFENCMIEAGPWSDTHQPRSADTIPDVRQSKEMAQGIVPCEESNEPGIDWCDFLGDNSEHTNGEATAQGRYRPIHDNPSENLLRQQLISAPSHAFISTQMLNGPSGEAISINVTQRPFDTFPGCSSKGGICVISCGLETGRGEGSNRH